MTNFKKSIALSFVLILLFASCNSTQQKASEPDKIIDSAALIQQGDTITDRVQKLLLTNVMTAMKAGGPVSAVTFCNVQAMPLTDSLSDEYNCLIQRVSDKYRNPVNILSESDLEIWETVSSSNSMKPVLISENGHPVYYKPIKIAMPACLTCHGTAGKEIDIKTLEIIKEKYPDDLATGYKEGDLRGLWKITFLKE